MPNSTEAYKTFLAKKESKTPIDFADLAARIDNEKPALFAFLIENDFVQVHRLLHKSDAPGTIGQGMAFTPNRKNVEGKIDLLLIKKDYRTLNDILRNFVINERVSNFTSNPQLLEQMEMLQTIVRGSDGKLKMKVQLY